MTNGEKIVQLFPNAQVDQGETRIYVWLDHSSTTFDKKWWNAEYKELRCKDCRWWKDSDGKYRRGCGAESQCPINTHAVYCGEGYCYMFSPKVDMREVEE